MNDNQLYIYIWCIGPAYSGSYISVTAKTKSDAITYLEQKSLIKSIMGYDFDLNEKLDEYDRKDNGVVDETINTWLDLLKTRDPVITNVREGDSFCLDFGTG